MELRQPKKGWQWPPPLSEQEQKLYQQHKAVCHKFSESNGRCGGEKCPLFIPETSSCGYGEKEYEHIKLEG